MPLYLGLDSSTQSLTAIVIEVAGRTRRIVFESSFAFDAVLPHYGTHHGVLPHADPNVATSSPLMWVDALDRMMQQLRDSGLDLSSLAAISGSAQQHGSVYLNRDAWRTLSRLDSSRPLVDQVRDIFSRTESPIWMDSSTHQECEEIAQAVGGQDTLAQRTGSRAFERFTGPQIRKFSKQTPSAYHATDRIHLVSSFLASVLIGGDAPVDAGDGSGMNLMDLTSSTWWQVAVDATAPGLLTKLPVIAPSSSVAGTLAPYWRARYGLPAARVIAWSGDNLCSSVGTGLVKEGRIAVSLGTSDTVFGLMHEPRVDSASLGTLSVAPTGDYLGLTCFQNGSLARERVRDTNGMDWPAFSRTLDATPPGAAILLPWFEPEITPLVITPGVHRYGIAASPGPSDVRALIDSQMMTMALHSRWMGVDVKTIHATGGAAANRSILQTMADVFGAEVYQLEVANSAALGAALRAAHGDLNAADTGAEWDDVIEGFVAPIASSRLQPDGERHANYRELMSIYAACEAHALGHGPDPQPLIRRYRERR